jgi:hypothetical protein
MADAADINVSALCPAPRARYLEVVRDTASISVNLLPPAPAGSFVGGLFLSF